MCPDTHTDASYLTSTKATKYSRCQIHIKDNRYHILHHTRIRWKSLNIWSVVFMLTEKQTDKRQVKH